jgi:hypothetical protein
MTITSLTSFPKAGMLVGDYTKDVDRLKHSCLDDNFICSDVILFLHSSYYMEGYGLQIGLLVYRPMPLLSLWHEGGGILLHSCWQKYLACHRMIIYSEGHCACV